MIGEPSGRNTPLRGGLARLVTSPPVNAETPHGAPGAAERAGPLPAAPPSSPRAPLPRWLAPLGLTLLVLATFGQVVGFEFVWDDGNLIVNNPFLGRTDTLWRAWSHDFWQLRVRKKIKQSAA